VQDELIIFFENFVTDRRARLFHEILNNRTSYITVAMEDIYQSHNASAVLRTCDCFGIQDIHIIENRNEFQVNPDVALGSSKWLNIKKYSTLENNTINALKHLKSEGYRLVATLPDKDAVALRDFSIEKGKFALLFGTELTGLSSEARELADEYLHIPMYGFTESFNISVSAAIIIHYLVNKLHDSNISWCISGERKKEIYLQWLKNTVKHAEKLEQKFLNSRK
jgi:tRNA (guanosine-2'-O-)-methyltransferase